MAVVSYLPRGPESAEAVVLVEISLSQAQSLTVREQG
jgi:hypothetical protein